MNPSSNRADLLRNTAIIIWDELPSANIAVMESIHEVCCRVTGQNRPFGGIPFVGVGDFRQVAPVVKGHGSAPTLLACIKNAPVWKQFLQISLQYPYRGASDPEYTAFVDNIGEDHRHDRATLHMLDTVHDVTEALDFLFPDHILQEPFKSLKRAFLSPINSHVDEFNEHVLRRLPGSKSTLLN
jgi:hypothetical protein